MRPSGLSRIFQGSSVSPNFPGLFAYSRTLRTCRVLPNSYPPPPPGRSGTAYSSRSAMANSSFLMKALGKSPAILPRRMIASSAVRQLPTVTLK